MARFVRRKGLDSYLKKLKVSECVCVDELSGVKMWCPRRVQYMIGD